MDTLQNRLAELADDAPTGGAPAAELWARGKRAHRLRAAALAATLVVVGAVGTGIGVRLAGGEGDRAVPDPAGTVGVTLPIEYPEGEELPELGEAPGPLAAIWLAPRGASAAPEAVGLVAETGTFGTLAINLPADDPGGPDYMVVALSPDGRRMAYPSPTGELIVHDLVSGENYNWPALEFETRAGYDWIDATHLLGHVAGGTDGDGWVWEPGRATAPERVDWYSVPYGGTNLSVPMSGLGPEECAPPNVSPMVENETLAGQGSAGSFDVPVLCDVLGVVPGSEILLGHWNSDRLPGGWSDPNDGNRTVVALDIHGTDPPEAFSENSESYQGFDDPALRRVVVAARAPERVSLATGLIGEALDADGGAS